MKQILLCLVLVAAATAGWYFYENPHMVGLARESAASDGPRDRSAGGGRIPGLLSGGAVNVITAPVEIDPGGERVVALGTARAARSITLYPEVTGMVKEVLFTPGEGVAAGDELVRLEDDEQRIAVDRARVALDQAKATLDRSRALAESKTISSVALSDAESAVALAEIEVRSAEVDLRRRVVTAAFAGLTGLTDISAGDYVTSSTAIATLDDLSTLEVTFELAERWIGRIRLEQPITAAAQAIPGSEFPGEIVGIDNQVDATTRTLRVKAGLVNRESVLKTGMSVRVELDFATDQDLAVPSLSVQWDRRGSFVWRVVDSAARRADVVIVRRQSGIVVVKGDVAAGDLVVVEGTQRLREGAKVSDVSETPTIVEDDAGEGAPAAATPPAVSGGKPSQTPG